MKCASATACRTPRRATWSDAGGAVVSLSGAEYRLLRVLLQLHPQRILTRDQLLGLTQGREADVFDRLD